MSKVYFENIRTQIKKLISQSRFEIVIAVAWFTDKGLILELENCIRRGVNVSIILYDKSNDKALFKNLYNQNAKIATTSKLMHNKFCVIDKEIVINGSYNWTYSAQKNHENIQVSISKEIAKSFLKEFNMILNSPTTSYSKIENYFVDKEIRFQKYFEKQLQPSSFPILYKEEFIPILPLDSREEIIRHSLRKGDILSELGVEYSDHLYIYFENNSSYISYHKRLYSCFVEKWDPRHLLWSMKSEIKKKLDSTKNNIRFLIIDLIINPPIIELSQQNYTTKKNYLFKGKMVDFKRYNKENFILIGFENKFENRGKLKALLVNRKDFKLSKDLGFLDSNLVGHKGRIRITQDEILYHVKNYDRESNTVTYYYRSINLETFTENIEKSDKEREKAIREKILKKNTREYFDKAREHAIKNSPECYIATMVYKDPNHQNILKLRKYRDQVLLNHRITSFFVTIYYKISPSLVKTFNRNKLVNQMAKFIIEKIILLIDKAQSESK